MTAPYAPQTSVASVMPIGIAGDWHDLQSEESGFTEVGINTDTESLVFGCLMQRDTTTQYGIKQVTGTSNIIAGVLLFQRVYDYPTERDDYGPLPGLEVELARSGYLKVFSETAVTDEAAVHVRIGSENRTANPQAFLGGWRGTASTGNTMAFDRSAMRFKQTLAASGITILELHLPPGTASTPTAD